ncbi:hypothetical protein V8F06_014386 [Rhypophila decipiens]
MCGFLKYLFLCQTGSPEKWDKLFGVPRSWDHEEHPRLEVINVLYRCPQANSASGKCLDTTFYNRDPVVYPMICYKSREAFIRAWMDKMVNVTRSKTRELWKKNNVSDDFIKAVEDALRELNASLLHMFHEEERRLEQEWSETIAHLQKQSIKGQPLRDPIPKFKPLDYESYNTKYEKLAFEGGKILALSTWNDKKPESSSGDPEEKKRLEKKRLEDQFHREMAKATGNGAKGLVQVLTDATGIAPRQPHVG